MQHPNFKLASFDPLIARKAHKKVATEIKAGRLIRGACQVCGKLNAEAHHEDYTKPLDVIWLCKNHHAEYNHDPRYIQRLLGIPRP